MLLSLRWLVFVFDLPGLATKEGVISFLSQIMMARVCGGVPSLLIEPKVG